MYLKEKYCIIKKKAGRFYSMDCLFCKIIAGEIPSSKVYEDEWVYAFRDLVCRRDVRLGDYQNVYRCLRRDIAKGIDPFILIHLA